MKIFYKCDPKKNKMCTRRTGRGFAMCQRECFATSIVEYAMRDKPGRPIVCFTTEGQEENKLVIHGAQREGRHASAFSFGKTYTAERKPGAGAWRCKWDKKKIRRCMPSYLS